MRIVSANLNRRLGNRVAQELFESWLKAKIPDLIVLQEPFSFGKQDLPQFQGYLMVQATKYTCAWISDGVGCPQCVERGERWIEFRFGNLVVHSVYLSPSSSSARAEMLLDIARVVERSALRPCLIVGDFNLAPRPEDGCFGEQQSLFTRTQERRAFQHLLGAGDLFDATCRGPKQRSEFTFERAQRGKTMRFRCDLALLSRELDGSALVVYDHSVRLGSAAFTDHSAIVVDLQTNRLSSIAAGFGRNEVSSAGSDRGPADALMTAANSHKTAIARRAASQIARKLHSQGVLSNLRVQSILDYGCGYGTDVAFYRALGYDADGFDAEPAFGWTDTHEKLYDLVTLVFVVNVLPSSADRIACLRAAARRVRSGGLLLVAARSASTILREARTHQWTPTNDGWISCPRKKTFQKGFLRGEMIDLLACIDFRVVDCPLRLSPDVSWVLGSLGGVVNAPFHQRVGIE